MRLVIGISVGEIVLKGKNRRHFEDALINKIRRSLDEIEIERIYKEIGKIYVDLKNESDIDEGINRIKNVFGIVYVSKCFKVDKSLELVEDAIDKAI